MRARRFLYPTCLNQLRGQRKIASGRSIHVLPLGYPSELPMSYWSQSMSQEFKRSWTEADVMALIGQTESIRSEFKSGVMFGEPESKWIENLSKEVSAFANTEG